MRHKKSFNHLSRKTGHRKAMLANMASSLILHKRIETTTAKAKALKRYIEPLITRSREDSTHSRRVVFSYLQDKEAVTELFREVSVKVGDRPGGYTRIIRLGNRLGDNADMCLIELVDYNENLLAEKTAAQKSTSRRRRGRKKISGDAPKTAPAEAKEQSKAQEAADAEVPPVVDEKKEESGENAEEEKPSDREADEEKPGDREADEEKPGDREADEEKPGDREADEEKESDKEK